MSQEENLKQLEKENRRLAKKLERCREELISAEEVKERYAAFTNRLMNEVRESNQKLSERTAELAKSKDAAEAASRFKSSFLANMSHEIRTPMNAIIGFAEIALRSELSPTLRDYLTKILSSSEALLAILNDILDYSKVEAGRLDIDPVEFCPEGLIEKVANLFSALVSEKGLELVFEIDTSVSDSLVGDPVRIGQVLINLVGNAVKFTAKGQVHIKLSQVEDEPGYALVNIQVRDTGIGMSPSQVDSLFQPFTQADSSITRRFGGTGLGLAISSRLVVLMGGKLTVQSEQNVGSTFSFTLRLPLSGKEERNRIPANITVSRVLIVDDVEISRRVLSETCRAWGLETVVADSGLSALAELRSANSMDKAFDLVLLDWKMPGMDGLALTRAIRGDVQDGRIGKLPVVIMTTAFSREQLMKEAADVTLDAILVKPVMPSALLEAILSVQPGGMKKDPGAVPRRWAAAPAHMRGARILLVEDNEINQFVARAFLTNAGVRVSVASDGREAVAAVLGGDFDAVLMDVHMPGMDGLEAARLIRGDGRFRDLPIIAMTGAVMSEDKAACYLAGMNDHVPKPILPDDLVAVLGKWLKPRERQGSEMAESTGREIGRTTPRLFRLPGFEFAQVLQMLGGNEARLRELLVQFAKEFGDADATLQRDIAQGNFAEAAALVHKIKGVAGNLGAYVLEAAAGVLEVQLGSGAAPEGGAEFSSAIRQALEEIAMLEAPAAEMDPGSAPRCEQCDRAMAAELFGELTNCLNNNEIVPQELLSQLAKSLPCQPISRSLAKVERLVGKLDYRGARIALSGLHCEMGLSLELE